VGGYTTQCLEVADAVYRTVGIRTVPVSSTEVAEAAKLLEKHLPGGQHCSGE